MIQQKVKKILGIILIASLVITSIPTAALAGFHNPVNVNVVFVDGNRNLHGSYQAMVEKGQTALTYLDTDKIQSGYMLSGTNPDLTIRSDNKGSLFVNIPVKPRGNKNVTTYATPRGSFSGNSIYVKNLRQEKDTGVVVPDGKTVYPVTEGFVVKRVIATGFNYRADSFDVSEGEKLYVTSDAPSLRYVFGKTGAQVPQSGWQPQKGTENVTTYATPKGSFSGNSIYIKKLTQEKDKGILVPDGKSIYPGTEGYAVKEIIATGFNHRAGSFSVKTGEKLYVSSDAPALRYVFEKNTGNKPVDESEPEDDIDVPEASIPSSQHALVTMIAGPDGVVNGSGVVSKGLALDGDKRITVPYGDSVFQKKESYRVKKITATGFNHKDSAFPVQPGDRLLVTSGAPVLKYEYKYSVKDVVTLKIGSETIVINNQEIEIDTPAFISENRTYVPFRALVEAFEADVVYNDKARTVTAELDGTKVVMTIGSMYYTVNGVKHRMDVAPFITNERTVIPVRFVAEAFGIAVTPIYNDNHITAEVVFVG